jgi:F-type H+-transporting ATPase subunit epsilon
MPDSFRLQIVTPERTVYSEEVVSMIAPGVDGYFGVLAHHAPMLAEVGVGRLVAERAGGARDVLSVAGGFLQVRDDATMVLADAAEARENIDLQRARQALERARERLADRAPGLDVERAESARQRAMSRIEIAG